MATLADDTGSAATREQPFFQRMLIGIAVVILIGFAQFAALGRVDYTTAPWWVHLHGLAMVGWLVLLIAQSTLVQRGNVALHKQIGIFGAALAALIVVLGIFTARRSIELHRVPPFFSDAFFLALTHVGLLVFAGLIVAALINRTRPEWHRRLMLGAVILLMEPGFGRLLPMPLLGAEWGEWLIMVIQLATLVPVIMFDRRKFGTTHMATRAVIFLMFFTHATVSLVAKMPPAIAAAASLAVN